MKILMTLMGLEIGGAETHVVELSMELKRRGHDVIIVSAGGAYQKDIEAVGIRHYYAPLLSHGGMIKAFFSLLNVINKEMPDVVHAHARIPAFLCHLINKFNKSFVFVTSCHGVYNTDGIIGKLTRWGEKQMAVSDDIKNYLVQNYKKVKKENVFVSVNGVDTEKFNENIDSSHIAKEFGLQEECTRIVYVSRLEPDVCEGAYSLVRLAPSLIEKIPDLEIIIVGDGSSYGELKERADEINKQADRNAVVLTGARTDVYKINALATFCVATSRSALEEMSQGKPCIMAGSFGYMGIFNKDKLATAISNNFTCRDTVTLTDDLLYQDILTLYNMPSEEKQELGKYCRYVVKEYYSLWKMANDNIKMYQSAIEEGKYDVAILGYYGFRNSGDDTLLQAIIGSLRKRNPNLKIMVFSNNPEETARIYNVFSAYRFDIFKVNKILKNTRLFIMGGGSLLQDGTSSRSIFYYTYCLCRAKKLCKKTMLYANGIGPLKHSFSRFLAKKALKEVSAITLRDEDSFIDLANLGVSKRAYITADPVFSLRNIADESASCELLSRGIEKGEKYICVSPRKWKGQPENFISHFAKLCDYISKEYGTKTVFLPMQYPLDARVIRQIQEKMKTPNCFIDTRLSPEKILGIIKGCELTIGVRLHLLIYSSTVGVPGIGIVYDPKVSSFQRYIKQPYFIEPRGLVAGDYVSVIDDCFKNRGSIVTELERISLEMEEKSEQTADIAMSLIKDGK
ncbi:MAG: polysaccharide pyruvyl transferase CsaB [Clostridia bacterium]|nr:polysaccharide pyruvyl transferase CsaB [Clostridia bacterium]